MLLNLTLGRDMAFQDEPGKPLASAYYDHLGGAVAMDAGHESMWVWKHPPRGRADTDTGYGRRQGGGADAKQGAENLT